MSTIAIRWFGRTLLGVGLLLPVGTVWAEVEPRPLSEPTATSEPAPLDSTESVDATPVTGSAAPASSSPAPKAAKPASKAAAQAPSASNPVVPAPVSQMPVSKLAAESNTPSDKMPADSILNKTKGEVIRERNTNGTVKVERYVSQDDDGNYLNHGTWTQWDEKGQIVGTGEYNKGKRQGKWVRWYGPQESTSFSGPIYKDFQPPFAAEANFENGVLNGSWRVFDSKNRKICEWEFADGQRNGKSIWYYMTGQKRKELDYVNNQLDGEATDFGVDGKVLSRDKYLAGRKLVLQVEYFDAAHKDGQKKSEGWVLAPRDLTKHEYDWWTGKAVINILGKEGENQKHGTWTWWHQNGQKQMEGRYDENQPVGKFTWWYANGQKQLEGEYIAGRQNGKFIWWHANGQKECEGTYLAGEQAGKWLRWSTEGKVVEAGDYTGENRGGGMIAPKNVAPVAETEPVGTPRVTERSPAEPGKLRK